MKLFTASTGMFSALLLLSLIFNSPNPAVARGLPAEFTTPATLEKGSIFYIQKAAIPFSSPTSGMGQQTGSPGSRITIKAGGFRPFTPVKSIQIDNIEILSTSTVTTDENGNFEATNLLVSGLDPGIYTLVIRVGSGDNEVTSASTFEVTSATESTAPGVVAAQALGPLGNHLERAFHFDNATKSWAFYDPRPEFASANTIDQLVEGQVYWIKVTQNATAVLNGSERTLTCVNENMPKEDCWNLLVW
jgi:hypothetical protein